MIIRFDNIVDRLLEESLQRPKYEAVTTKEYKRAYMEEQGMKRGWLMHVVPLEDADLVGPKFKHLGKLKIYKQIDTDSDEAKHIKDVWKRADLITGRNLKISMDMSEDDIKKYKIADSFDSEYIINDSSEVDRKIPSYYRTKRTVYWLEPTVESDDTQDAFGDFVGGL